MTRVTVLVPRKKSILAYAQPPTGWSHLTSPEDKIKARHQEIWYRKIFAPKTLQPMAAASERFRVAIIGGGIGGLFAALAIHHNCKDLPVDIDVYEQASEFKEVGAGVGLAINSARMVHNIGLGDKLNAISGFRSGVWIDFRRFDNGESIISIPADDTKAVRQASCARTDLLELFRHAIEERKAAKLHTKKKFSRVEDNGDRHVTVYFADSTSVPANAVLACDGIHSSVRSQFVDDRPVYSGQIAYRATIPTAELEGWWPFGTYSIMWCGKHKHFLTYPISCNRTLNVVAFANASGKDAEMVAESWTSTCDRAEVEADYRLFEPTVQRLISLMPNQPSKWRINDREPLDRWSYMGGKVILLGDAAHASEYPCFQ